MTHAAATTLIAMGGALDLKSPGAALLEFHRRAGGDQAKIVILPTASTLANAGSEISAALQRLGLSQPPIILPILDRAAAHHAEYCAAIEQASGIFFAGGNQLRLTAILGGTPAEQALQSAHRQGAVIAGSSAGAAVLSQVMLAYGKRGATPRTGMAQFTPGLGFTRRVIFDQHFRQRDRLGRLIYAVANHPGVWGVGIDENTAAILIESQADGAARNASLQVVGQHAVTLIDAHSIQSSDVADLKNGRPVAISGLQVHILTHGCTFNLDTGQVYIPEKTLPVE
jgi:cyanophycinase